MASQTRGQESGLYFSEDIFRPKKIGDGLGTINSIDFDTANNIWVGTKKNGAYLFRNEIETNHFTFENTAGGLRSNEILSVFVDRENVVWFGTDKGVCRFDLQSPKNELITDSAQTNFVRTIFKTTSEPCLPEQIAVCFINAQNGIWTAVRGLENNRFFLSKNFIPDKFPSAQ